jgi:3-hydroxyacyl-[acyl-carrier-protein] dehydratase
LLDRITRFDVGKSVDGCKCWTLSDDIFEQHFPGYPIVPGIFIIESMAQMLGLLMEKSYSQKFPDDQGIYAVLSIVHKAKFKRFVVPGDKTEMQGILKKLDKHHGHGEVKAYVDGHLCAQAELTYVLTSKNSLLNPRLTKMQDEYFSILTRELKASDHPAP